MNASKETRSPNTGKPSLKERSPTPARLAQLAALFPDAFNNGQLDVQALLGALGAENPPDKERYGLNWPGKQACLALAQTPATHDLELDRTSSLHGDQTEHQLIEGDNLEVLKLLQASHADQIKLIYIDPPYNTGSDFIYADNYADSVNHYLSISGQAGQDVKDLQNEAELRGRFHARWLSMMAPRLWLARSLLREDGVIAISIDDNELAHLRLLCDEIFGAAHFLNCVAVKMSEASGLKMTHITARLPKLKEYVLIYRKSERAQLNPLALQTEQWNPEYRTFVDGVSQAALAHIKALIKQRPVKPELLTMVNTLLAPARLLSCEEAYKRYGKGKDEADWRWENAWRIVQAVGSTSVRKLAIEAQQPPTQAIRALISPTGRLYLYRTDFNQQARAPRVQILFADMNSQVKLGDFWADIKTTGAVGMEGGVAFPNGKKPQRLMRRLLQIFTSADTHDWVLDFFAGSGSTGQAVLDQNLDDGGNRRFILVQWPEPIAKHESLSAQGFRHIAEVTAARLKNVIHANQSGGFQCFKLTARSSNGSSSLPASGTARPRSPQPE